MVAERTADALDPSRPDGRPGEFVSLLAEAPSAPVTGAQTDQLALTDLRLDQVIEAVAADRDEADLIAGLLSHPADDPATVRYRHEVFRDLEDPGLLAAVQEFSAKVRVVRGHLDQLAKMRSAQQQQGWLLDAAAIYCSAVRSFAAGLGDRPVSSRGLRSFADHLAGYVSSPEFGTLAADVTARRRELAEITYLVRIKGLRVEVSKYDGEPDYRAEIEETFERFRQGAAEDYLIEYRGWLGMNHVGAKIAELVARLFDEEFSALEDFCRRHAGFLDAGLRQFDQEIQFYLAYLEYIGPLRKAGLSFCLPELSADSKEVFASQAFDLALASRLVRGGSAVVTNEFALHEPERIIVISGPNQGGKTTFARMFGQLHHLGRTGCPVPGTRARLYLADRIFTHFEREEDIADLAGKLEDDLLRIQKALLEATPRSIVIMNEIFTSTTLSDARFLGQKVLGKLADLDLLCVYVTFIDELASFGPTVVSMVSTIAAGNPAERTFKVVRKPADGLAYALAIAGQHRVTYDQLVQRIES